MIKAVTPPKTCKACTPTITYKNEKATLRVNVKPLFQNSLNPKYCNKTKVTPRTALAKSQPLYFRI